MHIISHITLLIILHITLLHIITGLDVDKRLSKSIYFHRIISDYKKTHIINVLIGYIFERPSTSGRYLIYVVERTPKYESNKCSLSAIFFTSLWIRKLAICDGESITIPVSYTHLDVYKRQL